ncbi:alpha/beta hydrolase domain-containing protein [Noviherbaspirillum sp. CPCC 100848]|uniref:Alpha/beta hydrolase domain-containing protein n=1 Tax=Noviherbaspirillum album TaxID=3080276 RepID=A0ABU6J324_9BURK|nr:alpha/beta hydrolase domain-containing protein [Noviherbaspirillum sp. CPCC 100848]MEC4718025.1 alpha/beta hydrolase domain-containing protein [Noviherbaspirillum sp. CPCC 100848]
MQNRSFTLAAATAAAAAVSMLSACGSGSDSTSVSAPSVTTSTPRQTLSIASTRDFTPGTSYGSVGAYEQVTGTIKGEVDPKDPKNAIIQDLSLAPVNANGMVEYTADFVMLKPKDMSKANGVLRYDAPNRGNILTMINPAASPSDAVYLERGYVILYSAWQGDVPKSNPNRLTVSVPVARNPDGSSITGPYRAELVPSAAVPVMTLPGGVFNGTMIPYAPASLDNTQPGYALTRRANETDPRTPVPASDWKFANCDSGDSGNGAANSFPGTPDPTRICLKGGFDPKYLYEIVYVAKDPLVMGVGLAALRDTVSFFRGKAADAAGNANPLAGRITHTLGQGTSQSGNAMKTFLHLGFNQALDGGKVFDGMYAHVAARQTNVNTRFAVPGGGGGLRTDHTAFGQTAPRGLDKDYVDELSGRKGGVMARCAATNTCPKFFLGLSGTEFWQLQGSPVLTDTYGFRDLAQPENARIYYYSSTQHGGPGGTASISYDPSRDVYPRGTVAHFNDTFRALFLNLEDWVTRNTAPPASQVPKIADGTLVRPEQLKFPVMKGLTWAAGGAQGTQTPIPEFNYLARYNGFPLLDFGPQYKPQDESGIATQLPPFYTGKDYAILVPQVDARTGLTLAGVRGVEVQAPLGTSIEFNYVATPGIVDLSNLGGSFIPFHRTEAARIAAGDTRPSLESLYGSQAGYVAAVTQAANALVGQRFLLQRDAERIIRNAGATPVLP